MYPVSFEADIPTEGRNRLTTFFRYFTAIPIDIVAFLYAFGALFAVIVAWFAIVFTGRYPRGVYDFIAKAVRIGARANSYRFLLVDQYPPFNGDDDPSYPVRVGIAPPLDKYSRLKTFFRGLLAIPVEILAFIWSIILYVVAFIAWFAILFTGRLPEGLTGPMHGAVAYGTRAGGYYFLLTEGWPPFSDDGGAPPAGQIGAGTKVESR